jgi:predicted amidophosphoribosyltransferase
MCGTVARSRKFPGGSENFHGAFRLRKNQDVRDLRVLLIDDVLFSGSTLSECACVLKTAGAVSIHAATAARA